MPRATMRRTLHYDHKRRVSPSKATQNPTSLSPATLDSFPCVEPVGETTSTSAEAQDDLLKFQAGVLALRGHKACAGCGNSIEAAATWYLLLCVTQTSPDKADSIKPARLCLNCGRTQGERYE